MGYLVELPWDIWWNYHGLRGGLPWNYHGLRGGTTVELPWDTWWDYQGLSGGTTIGYLVGQVPCDLGLFMRILHPAN